MKTLRIALFGLLLSAGLMAGAYAHGPQVGFSVNLGYPVRVAPPVYYTPPPPIVYVPPPRIYTPPPPLVIAPSYGHMGNPYYYGDGLHRGWEKNRHHRHHHH